MKTHEKVAQLDRCLCEWAWPPNGWTHLDFCKKKGTDGKTGR